MCAKRSKTASSVSTSPTTSKGRRADSKGKSKRQKAKGKREDDSPRCSRQPTAMKDTALVVSYFCLLPFYFSLRYRPAVAHEGRAARRGRASPRRGFKISERSLEIWSRPATAAPHTRRLCAEIRAPANGISVACLDLCPPELSLKH